VISQLKNILSVVALRGCNFSELLEGMQLSLVATGSIYTDPTTWRTVNAGWPEYASSLSYASSFSKYRRS
jgi:hypothetical protein